jgi:hypothetical protein
MIVYDIRDLVKVYPGQTTLANRNITLQIHQGEIFGLLGDNGAGKSTLVRQMVNLVRSTSGNITLFGQPIQRDPLYVPMNVGYMPQDGLALNNLTHGFPTDYSDWQVFTGHSAGGDPTFGHRRTDRREHAQSARGKLSQPAHDAGVAGPRSRHRAAGTLAWHHADFGTLESRHLSRVRVTASIARPTHATHLARLGGAGRSLCRDLWAGESQDGLETTITGDEMMSRILVIGDPGVNELIRLILERQRDQARCTSDGRIGLSAAEQDRPDMIIIYLWTQGLNAFEFYE